MPDDDPGKKSKHVVIPPTMNETNVDTVLSILLPFDYLLCDCPKLYLSADEKTKGSEPNGNKNYLNLFCLQFFYESNLIYYCGPKILEL
jgi:hypothetical protein